ncbi:hypothetical protein FC83_GL003143 [Agrilactobacillus composti DSM 18527 = JCM 14202]|uniref:Uncharacterized protein n=1 Tax=Agrilactobacillus composti DSM 18527 = JCM 14202 TaxID=1423734 RepID=X0QJ14_9LACO|nr:hypothetical protein [Agrilactobacillus composti]KRM33063.1 hypothetical protein FC83_GL003143 [Agrilactobacillus composti DSM 18527 = JCM 14202]GAF38590.1 hypothetical protein JCM14202_406 [Agrilactobacillus composti DSM 18527 = JCM 14202]
MLTVNAKTYVNIDFDEVSIQTSGMYAVPYDDAKTRQKVFETLQALFKQAPKDVDFALSIMTTMAEIIVSPLGLMDFDAVKAYGPNQDLDYDHLSDDATMVWPLAVRYISHTSDEKPQDTIVASQLELKQDFAGAFEPLWQAIKADLAKSDATMAQMLSTLITDSQQVEADFQQQLSTLDTQQRADKVGFELPENEVDQFAKYMSDSHEVMNIVRSAASFVQSELVQAKPFSQVFSDAHYRTTYYWTLDNTFYELYYYYLHKYGDSHPKLTKFLNHRQDQLVTQMRQRALKDSQQISEDPKANLKPDMSKIFDHIFLPLNEEILTMIFDFDVK